MPKSSFVKPLDEQKVAVPIQKQPPKKATPKKAHSYPKKFLKFLFWVGIILLLYLYYAPLKNQLIRLLQLNPVVWKIYLAMSREITASTLLGLFLTSFFGAIFFISIPVELIFLYYLSLSFSPVEVVVYVVIGNMLGMMVNYAIGFLLGPGLLRKALKEKYDVWHRRTQKNGALVLFAGNIIPFPIELIALFMGGMRYSFKKFVIYTFLGKLAKFAILYYGYLYFSQSLTGYWQGYLWPWLLRAYEIYVAPVTGLF